MSSQPVLQPPVSEQSTSVPIGAAQAYTLTMRQLEVLQLVVDGMSNKEIAVALGLSSNTVAVHRANIMRGLGLHKTAELVVYALRNRLVSIPEAS